MALNAPKWKDQCYRKHTASALQGALYYGEGTIETLIREPCCSVTCFFREGKRLAPQTTEGPMPGLRDRFVLNARCIVNLHINVSFLFHSGTINEDAREVVDDLNRSLIEQPESTAALLEQPTRIATPVILPRVLSLGPKEVTDEERAQEKVEQRATSMRAQEKEAAQPKVKKRCLSTPGPSGAKKAKTAKPIAPELKERQERASARMVELGILTQEVS